MNASKSAAIVFVAATLLAPLTGRAADPAPAAATKIEPKDARNHVDQRVTVTFKVQHTKASTDPDRVYIDSEKDYKDPANLGLLIDAAGLAAFKKAGIEKPAEHFDGKTVRVTGKVFLKDGLVFIALEKPGQIEIVKTPAGDGA